MLQIFTLDYIFFNYMHGTLYSSYFIHFLLTQNIIKTPLPLMTHIELLLKIHFLETHYNWIKFET